MATFTHHLCQQSTPVVLYEQFQRDSLPVGKGRKGGIGPLQACCIQRTYRLLGMCFYLGKQ